MNRRQALITGIAALGLPVFLSDRPSAANEISTIEIGEPTGGTVTFRSHLDPNSFFQYQVAENGHPARLIAAFGFFADAAFTFEGNSVILEFHQPIETPTQVIVEQDSERAIDFFQMICPREPTP